MSEILDKIKQVQEKTGCLTLEAKRFLDESNGDIEMAVRLYQESAINKGNTGAHLSLQDVYNKGLEFKNNQDYLSAINEFKKIKGFDDADNQIKECEELEKEKNYQEALSLKEQNELEASKEAFLKLEDYKDSKEQIVEIDALLNKIKYESALSLKEEKKYQEAIDTFKEIKDFEDSETQIKECEELLKESIYTASIFKGSLKNKKDEERVKECIKGLKTIIEYKDTKELVEKYQKMLDDYLKAQKKKKKRKGLIASLTTVTLVLLVGALAINYFVLLPNKRSENATNLINEGKYQEAEEELNKFSLIKKGDTPKLKAISQTGQSFEKGDYEEGLHTMYEAGGTTEIKFDANGGSSTKGSQTVKKVHEANFVTAAASKKGYYFEGWEVDDFSFNIADFQADLKLKATYSLATYTINYRLDGGINNPDNPSSYTIETDFTLLPASKEGYTFEKWVDQGGNEITQLKGLATNLSLIAIYNQGNEYTVSLNANGGEVSSNSVNVTFNHEYQLPIPTRKGYDFVGWYNDNEKVENTGTWKEAKNVSLTARWSPVSYTITYNLNGGINADNPATYTVEDTIILKAPSKSYYNFVEWRYNGTAITSIDTSLAKDITIEAIWDVITYNITYNLNGGTLPNGYVSTYSYETATFNLPIPTRDGYTFMGWYDNASFNGTAIASIVRHSHDDKVFYAKWSANTYSITYNLNGGTNNENNPVTYTPDDNINLLEPTKTGYTFIGWVDQNSQPISTIGNGLYGDLVLTAKYNEGNFYQVTLNPNGGSLSEQSKQVQYDHGYELPTPTRDGYDFDGWYDASNYVPKTGLWKFASDKTLVAHWSPIVYHITYNLNGGTNSDLNPTTYTIEQGYNLYPASKKGYSFEGWFDNNNKKYSIISPGTMGDLVLNARYNDGNNYTVTLNPDGGELENNTVEVQYDHAYELPEPTKRGYKFLGWFDGDSKIASSGTWNFDSDKSLKAHWELIVYTITYNLNGGQGNTNPTTYTVESETINLTPVSKTGYLFMSWHDESNHDISSIPQGSIGDRTLSAYFVAKNFVLILNANGGECIYPSLNLVYDEHYEIPNPTRDGYEFEGWYLNDDLIPSSGNWNYTEATTTVVAHWSALTYNITYSFDSGLTNDPRNPSSYTIETATITLYPLSKTGYTFLGWYNGDTRVETIPQGSTGHLNLQARFNDGDEYQITIDPNGGAFVDNGATEPRTITVQYDHQFEIPEVQYRGYYFQYFEASDGSVAFTSRTGVWTYIGDKYQTIKYHWHAIAYTLLFNFTCNGEAFTGSDLSNITSPYGGYNSSLGQFRGEYYINGNQNMSSGASKPGYDFVGWFINNVQVNGIPAGTIGQFTIEGRFEPKVLTITLDAGNGAYIDGSNTVSITYKGAYSLPEPNIYDPYLGDNTYSVFTGWYYGAQRIPTTGSEWTYSTSNITLTATYDAAYEFFYVVDSNYGYNDPRNPTLILHGETTTLYPAICTKTGWDFGSWVDNFGVTHYDSIVVDQPDMYVTARFGKHTYHITINAVGGDISLSSLDLEYGETFSIPEAQDVLPFQYWALYENGVYKDQYFYADINYAWRYDFRGNLELRAVYGH